MHILWGCLAALSLFAPTRSLTHSLSSVALGYISVGVCLLWLGAIASRYHASQQGDSTHTRGGGIISYIAFCICSLVTCLLCVPASLIVIVFALRNRSHYKGNVNALWLTSMSLMSFCANIHNALWHNERTQTQMIWKLNTMSRKIYLVLITNLTSIVSTTISLPPLSIYLLLW